MERVYILRSSCARCTLLTGGTQCAVVAKVAARSSTVVDVNNACSVLTTWTAEIRKAARARGPFPSLRACHGVALIEPNDNQRDVVAAPGIICLREQLLRGNLGYGLRGERGRDRLVGHHLRQSVRTQQ